MKPPATPCAECCGAVRAVPTGVLDSDTLSLPTPAVRVRMFTSFLSCNDAVLPYNLVDWGKSPMTPVQGYRGRRGSCL